MREKFPHVLLSYFQIGNAFMQFKIQMYKRTESERLSTYPCSARPSFLLQGFCRATRVFCVLSEGHYAYTSNTHNSSALFSNANRNTVFDTHHSMPCFYAKKCLLNMFSFQYIKDFSICDPYLKITPHNRGSFCFSLFCPLFYGFSVLFWF